jgi:hypothetical protein
MMMRQLLIIFGLTLLWSCSEESGQKGNKENSEDQKSQEESSFSQSESNKEMTNKDSLSIMDYFYPVKEEPYVYAFLDESNPLSERFFRYINLEKDGQKVLVIEMYNQTFRIFEGFTLADNSFEIIDHMKVDREGIKRSSKITKNEYFPKNLDDQSVFIADFPSHLDSIIMIYESRKNIVETDLEMDVLGDKLPAIKVMDSVRVHMVNVRTKAASTQEAPIYRYYAKGIGQVRFEGVGTDVQYNLNKVLTESWWRKYAQ